MEIGGEGMDTNKKKKFTLKSSKTRKLIKQYASDFLDFDIHLDS